MRMQFYLLVNDKSRAPQHSALPDHVTARCHSGTDESFSQICVQAACDPVLGNAQNRDKHANLVAGVESNGPWHQKSA
jgi:hypothetical protein